MHAYAFMIRLPEPFDDHIELDSMIDVSKLAFREADVSKRIQQTYDSDYGSQESQSLRFMSIRATGTNDTDRNLYYLTSHVELDREDIHNYINSMSRKEISNILKNQRVKNFNIPCFGSNINNDPHHYNELHKAVKAGNIEDIDQLSKYIDIDHPDQGGWSPLIWAIDRNQVESVNTLINLNADVNYTSIYDKQTPVKEAISSDNVEILKILVENGGEINQDHINYAIEWDSLNSLKYLINEGIDVNFVDKNTDMTPLMLAAKNGRLDTVVALTHNGADPNVKNQEGMNAFEFSEYHDSIDILNYMRDNQQIYEHFYLKKQAMNQNKRHPKQRL